MWPSETSGTSGDTEVYSKNITIVYPSLPGRSPILTSLSLLHLAMSLSESKDRVFAGLKFAC